MKHVLPAAVAFTLLSVPLSGHAVPAKKAAPLAALSLALPQDHSLRAAGEPLIEARLINLSHNTLWLPWSPPYPIVFQVEFKPVLDAPSRDAGWMRLTPIPLPPPSTPDPSTTIVDEHREKLQCLPGKQSVIGLLSTGYLLDQIGFYRIRATLIYSQPTKLTLSAPPLIISHTADGYAAVSEIQPRKTP